MPEYDNKDDEIIAVNLPRKDYKILREVIERERTYTWFKAYMRSWWVWALAGGVITVLTLGDKINGIFHGVK